MSKQQQNTKAGLYYRLSKDDERARESLSIENQRRMLGKCAHENGFEIVDEYIDDGCSGTSFQRSDVQRLLEDAKNGMDMTPIMNVFNEWHAADTSKKIRAVIESNAKTGKYRTSQAPYCS